jgi:NADPH:quinone reductase-like Zn-dependent oxidoreductase
MPETTTIAENPQASAPIFAPKPVNRSCRGGHPLLILGATGGVGVLATQLAARAGITVIATARAEAGAWIESFGASETIDYTERSVAATLAYTHPDSIDAMLDLVGNAEQVTAAVQHVRDAGTVISTASASPMSLPARIASPPPTTSSTTSRPG